MIKYGYGTEHGAFEPCHTHSTKWSTSSLLFGFFVFTIPGFLDTMVYLLPWSELDNERIVKLSCYTAPLLAVLSLLLKIISLYISKGYAEITNLPIRIGLAMYGFTLFMLLGYLFGSDKQSSGSLVIIFTLPIGNFAMFVGLLQKHLEEWGSRY